MTGWAVIEEGGVSDVRTHGSRQLAVLATVAALLAAAIFLLGGTIAGLAVPGAGLALLLASWALVVVTLVSGWVPGIYLGFLLLGVGASLPSTELTVQRAAVLGVTIGLVHEAARFSLDTRKPTRLGESLLRRMSLGAVLATITVLLCWPLVARVIAREPDTIWIPAALGSLALPLLVPWLVERFGDRSPLGSVATAVRSVIAVILAASISVIVAMGAQNQALRRAARPANLGGDGSDAIDQPQPQPLYPETTPADYIGAVIGLLLAAAILGFLYGAFHRRQLIVEEGLETTLDDSVFGFSLPDRAELEDVAMDREDAAAMLGDLLVDLDNEPDPGRAIRFAFARVEQQLEARGAGRRSSETVHEAVARLLPQLGDARAMSELTSVFERARFSESPVDESARATARRALSALQGQLEGIAVAEEPEAES